MIILISSSTRKQTTLTLKTMLPGKIEFSHPVDNYKCESLSYNEFAFQINTRGSSNKNKRVPEEIPFFSFPSLNLSSIDFKNNFNESDFIELTKIENHFSFKSLTPPPSDKKQKKFPIRCNLRLNQIFLDKEAKEIFQLEMTLCPYTVFRDMKQKEKIKPVEQRKEFSFLYENDPFSYFEIICERANYNTIFGGEKMRNNDLFSYLQPQVGVLAKQLAKRKRKENSQRKKMQKIDNYCDYFSNEIPSDNNDNDVNNNNNNNINDVNNNNINGVNNNINEFNINIIQNSLDLCDQLMCNSYEDINNDINNGINNDIYYNAKYENNLSNSGRFETSLNDDYNYLSYFQCDFRNEVYIDFTIDQFISDIDTKTII